LNLKNYLTQELKECKKIFTLGAKKCRGEFFFTTLAQRIQDYIYMY